MKEVFIKRNNFTSKEALGSLSVVDLSKSSDEVWLCCTLELAWNDNHNNTSCIPAGKYLCRWTRSNRLSQMRAMDVYTYEVMGVPDRAGIRIHSANFFYSLLGCIALGSDFSDIDKDGETDLVNSRLTVQKFNEIMNKEDFSLIIS